MCLLTITAPPIQSQKSIPDPGHASDTSAQSRNSISNGYSNERKRHNAPGTPRRRCERRRAPSEHDLQGPHTVPYHTPCSNHLRSNTLGFIGCCTNKGLDQQAFAHSRRPRIVPYTGLLHSEFAPRSPASSHVPPLAFTPAHLSTCTRSQRLALPRTPHATADELSFLSIDRPAAADRHRIYRAVAYLQTITKIGPRLSFTSLA